MSKYQTKSIERQVVNEDTGELQLVEIVKEHKVKVKQDKFYMCFFEKMSSFYEIKHLADVKLMAAMCEVAEYEKGTVHLTRKVRQDICKKTGISISNISKNLKRLINLKLLSEDDGDYIVNAEVFWKGDIKSRKKFLEGEGLKLNIIFEAGGKDVQE